MAMWSAAVGAGLLLLAGFAGSAAAAEDNGPEGAGAGDPMITVESLLKGGWQIAGYSSALDGRTAFILFRHPQEPYLVQCRGGYDVTREPRVISNCYKLR